MARPLVKVTREGKPYIRPPSIEAKIDGTLDQDPETLCRRARVRDRRSPDYLPEECMVHLIRHSIRHRDHRVASLLMPFLLVRCEAALLTAVPDGKLHGAETIREEILSSFQLLFTGEASEGDLDYYECRFGRAFKTLRLSHVAHATGERKDLADLPEMTNDDGQPMPEDEALALLSRAARASVSQEDRIFLGQVLDALDGFPPDLRDVVVLRRIIGHTEEEVAKRLGVDCRTIRNRLSRAAKLLGKLKEGLMTESNINTPLREAMYEMSLAKAVPDADLLDDFTRRYPQHAKALTEFAIELAVDGLRHGDEDLDVPAEPDAISPVVSRVMSRFQNRLFEISQKAATTSQRTDVKSPARNPFASLDRKEFRTLATRLKMNTTLLTKVRDRLVNPKTIPPQFCARLVLEMKEDEDVIADHLAAPPALHLVGQHYKADGKPGVQAQQSFEDAVRGSGLTDEQQRQLLSLRD